MEFTVHKYFWFLLLVGFFVISASGTDDMTSKDSIFSGRKRDDWKIKMLILSSLYCKSTDSPKEAEELLAYQSEYVKPQGYWWKRYIVVGENFPHPMCSAFPNVPFPKMMPIARVPISRANFFRSRGIEIPIKPGRRLSYPIIFEHVNQNLTVWRRILQCDCSVLSDEVVNRNICDYGGVVHLARGVGGDRSFFVLSPASRTDFNVIAHICFPTKV